jgi:hypothetical protein
MPRRASAVCAQLVGELSWLAGEVPGDCRRWSGRKIRKLVGARILADDLAAGGKLYDRASTSQVQCIKRRPILTAETGTRYITLVNSHAA